jgi:hypothetical protein
VSRLSRQCGILNISQLHRPPRPITGKSLLFTFTDYKVLHYTSSSSSLGPNTLLSTLFSDPFNMCRLVQWSSTWGTRKHLPSYILTAQTLLTGVQCLSLQCEDDPDCCGGCCKGATCIDSKWAQMWTERFLLSVRNIIRRVGNLTRNSRKN